MIFVSSTSMFHIKVGMFPYLNVYVWNSAILICKWCWCVLTLFMNLLLLGMQFPWNIWKFLTRTHMVSSSHMVFLKEINNIKQTLVNNGFPNYIIESQIKLFLSKQSSSHNRNNINIPYQNQMYKNYKRNEFSVKNTIKMHHSSWTN